MSAIVRGACVNIFLVALSCVDLKRPAAPYLVYGACVCRFSFFKRMLRILLATVRDARASMFLITLSYGAPQSILRRPTAPYGAYGACGADFFFSFSRPHPEKKAAYFDYR
eukprot:scaffold440_cov73-Phaeocystis_antarctica.AAC.4